MTTRTTPSRADITRLEDKVDQLLADHVKQADLDKLESRLTVQIDKSASATYSKDHIDALSRQVEELKQQVGTAWARTLERWGIVASILYVAFNILHSMH